MCPRSTSLVLAVLVAAASCAPVKAGPPEAIRSRVESLDSARATIRGERLLQPKAVARFYQARQFEAAWAKGSIAEQVVNAIRGVEGDGLTPADYHLEAIEALREQRATADELADLELLLADAIAGLVDHVRYGRVLPVTLDRRWNVDPREGAPPLEQVLAEIAAASSPADAIEKAKRDHFIYRGLVGALARLREIAAAGGWPSVPAGKPIKPGATDPRIAAVRARLAVTGELDQDAPPDPALYDKTLLEAVKLFQRRHRLIDDGIIDKATVEAMDVPVGARVAQVRVNLERARWVLPGLRGDFLLVNLPAFKTYLIRGGKNEWEARIQIGEEARQTPSFRSDLKTVVFNPDWTVPPTILEKDVLEGMRKGVNMIAKKKLVILDASNRQVSPSSIDWNSATAASFPYTLRQPPGPGNALGRVKFLLPNRHSIYLHDTPHRTLFESEQRTFSSGCIRVERALELAHRLLQGQGWTPTRIQQAVASGKTQHVDIEAPPAVLIVYWTVSVGASGEIKYMRDVYGLDPPLLAALDRPLAARGSGSVGNAR
jgi:L,D-transpeptidase YcbB